MLVVVVKVEHMLHSPFFLAPCCTVRLQCSNRGKQVYPYLYYLECGGFKVPHIPETMVSGDVVGGTVNLVWKAKDCGMNNAQIGWVIGVDCASIFNDIRCNISLNPIEPRFLREHSFDIFYMNSEKGAIGGCIHEIIHFIWFYVWNEVFQDSYDEYEAPSLKWIFSEMVVESIMRDERLSSINPYFPRENGGCIYPYFFTMQTSDGLALDILDKMYREKNIRAFMKDGYEWCKLHENEIRSHIEQAER